MISLSGELIKKAESIDIVDWNILEFGGAKASVSVDGGWDVTLWLTGDGVSLVKTQERMRIVLCEVKKLTTKLNHKLRVINDLSKRRKHLREYENKISILKALRKL